MTSVIANDMIKDSMIPSTGKVAEYAFPAESMHGEANSLGRHIPGNRSQPAAPAPVVSLPP